MNRFLLAVSMVAVVCVVNASAAKELVFSKASKSLSMPEFVEFMMKYADDATIEAPKLRRALALPGAEQGPVPIKGDSTDPGEVGPNKSKAAQLVIRPSRPRPLADSIILVAEDDVPADHRGYSFEYKFDLKGRLVRAISSVGSIDDKGEGIPGTGTIEVLDISNKIQAQAQKELEFWRHYPAWELPRKKAAAEAKAKGVSPK